MWLSAKVRSRPAAVALGGAVQPRDLKSALRAYTSRPGYLRALTAGAPRVGIDGEPTGSVTPDEETVAKARLAELAKRVVPAVIAAKAPPTPAHRPQDTGLDPCHRRWESGSPGRAQEAVAGRPARGRAAAAP